MSHDEHLVHDAPTARCMMVLSVVVDRTDSWYVVGIGPDTDVSTETGVVLGTGVLMVFVVGVEVGI